MQIVKTKDCPRCGSHIFLDHDKYGWYLECVKCGYHRDVKVKPKVRATRLKPTEEKTVAIQ